MNELDVISEKILKQIIKYDNSLTNNQLKKLKCLNKYSDKKLIDCIIDLSNLEFIHLDKQKQVLVIDFKSKQYFLLKRKSLAKLIITSFFLPLLVSLITTLIMIKLTK